MQKYIDQVMSMAVEFLPKVLLTIVTLIVGFWIIKKITATFKKTLDKREIDETVKPFLVSLVSIGLKVLLCFSAAGIFGVETASFVAVLGALAFAIGMALQGSLGHFASGVLLLVFKPYQVGDVVEISGKIGTVKGIHIFNTILMTHDNKKVVIPNGVVTSGVIINITGQEEQKLVMTFGIGYGDDIDKARSVIKQVIDSCPNIMREKPIDIFVSELADSSVNFSVRVWAKNEHYWGINFYMQEHIKKAFDKEGIEIPFPQRSVHIEKTA
ncbi:mechanosensitive ion channel family protein [Arcticibacterium luteifluviistationis]|uniref:Mechanosensitive ion channel protein n=1 Tax=Arcticibacterium luteifluviistationis TaxID=1784714 RepID=A0A2Z4GDV7_9BACT|nr:mechanosensitive ion channel domain-containing protein [Arcticibacterium luteifluviistationis]AWV99331.1 mechanosensitive ion channel protein [Arcticibacterium luteifluviistationis]